MNRNGAEKKSRNKKIIIEREVAKYYVEEEKHVCKY